MKLIIVPTDFSDTSKNAARFAARFAEQVPGIELLLYNVFDRIDTESSDGSVVFNDHRSRKTIVEAALENIRQEMLSIAPTARISCLAEEEGNFIDSLERLARHKNARMIIMGITGATRLEQIFIGSNTLNIMHRDVCPVMIVPPKAGFTGIKNVALASDFRNVEATTPVKALREVLDIFRPFVHVVNVDSEHYVELSEEYKQQKDRLESQLKGFETDYYFIRQYDFVEAINQFVVDYNIDLLFTMPRKHGFLEAIFRPSYTKKLAYHSTVPIVAVTE